MPCKDVTDINLQPVKSNELETLWKMQIEAFSELLQKYQDYDMSLGAESIDAEDSFYLRLRQRCF